MSEASWVTGGTSESGSTGPAAGAAARSDAIALRGDSHHAVSGPGTTGTPAARCDLTVPSVPPSAVRRVLGLALICAAVALGIMTTEAWNDLVTWGGTTAGPQGDQTDPGVLQWIRWCLVAAFGLVTLVLHRSKPIWFLISTSILSGLIASTAFCADLLLQAELSWRPIVVCGVALGYLIQSTSRPARLSGVGVVGLLLVVLAGVGAVHGWYDATHIAARLGEGSRRFASNWGEEITWLTILTVATVGVLSSRTRPIHFLIAVLLVVLAYHCIMEGRTEIRAFPSLTKPGAELVTQPDVSYANIAAVRWAIAVELILIAAVLLYKAMGTGGLSVAFALAWMLLGCGFYDSLRTLSLQRFVAELGTASNTSPLANMGLPIDLRERSNPVRSAAAMPRRHAPNRLPPSRGIRTAPLTEEERAVAENAARATVRRTTWRELLLPVWMYLTAILAGVIGVAGLRMLLAGPAGRIWVSYALWLTFGIALTALWFADPKEPAQPWQSWLSDWTQSRYKLHVAWLFFVGAAAVAGSWAMPPLSRLDRWMNAAMICPFVGTALSLIGVSILIYRGGFAPLPVWTYIVIAAGQSSLAWVLMMHVNLTARQTTAATVSE